MQLQIYQFKDGSISVAIDNEDIMEFTNKNVSADVRELLEIISEDFDIPLKHFNQN